MKENSRSNLCPDEGTIYDYGIIGDCRAAALISRIGCLDWLCWPRFDSPAIFAGLLDPQRGGHWRISVLNCRSLDRRYLGESNVLETVFHGSSGTARVTDLMPVSAEEYKRTHTLPDHQIIRQVECTQGAVQLEIEFVPRANFGRDPVVIKDRGKLGWAIDVGRGIYWLSTNAALRIEDGRAKGLVVIESGQKLQFSLTYSEQAPAVLPPLGDWIEDAITRSVRWWEQWAQRAQYQGPYRNQVVRSALVLKLLTYAPSGAIVAAPTTSLPERIGGDLNWDYRYCWLRDASLTVRALLGLGYREEADDFVEWMLHATRLTRPELRIIYDLYGGLAPRERELDYLEGYRQSKPVRIGNGARHQLQLDVYGEVVDAAAQYAFHGGTFDGEMQKALLGFGRYVLENWNNPDEGIWEPRTGRQHHTHSRLLCWVALDRLAALADKGLIQRAPTDEYKAACQLIRRQLHHRAWNKHTQAYVSVLDGDSLDASLLLLSWYGFECSTAPRMRATHRRILDQLGAGNGLLYRYLQDPPEGAFSICSFWEAEFLALGGGTLEESHARLRTLLAHQSELGLYAEEIDPQTGEGLGNFPQAFTHIGLIGAALSIEEREAGAKQLAHRPEQARGAQETEEVAT